MSARWKRNAVVATVLLFVCAAVYLNWRYAGNVAEDAAPTGQQEEEQGGSTKVLGDATLVGGVPTIAADQGESPEAPQAPAASSYFDTARLSRQQSRDNALSLLREAAEQENADANVANEASQGIQVLASYTLAEAQIENLVTAKGYADCVAFMGDESVSVVVSTKSGDLTAEDVAKITDITMTETGLPAGNIKIMAAN